MKKLLQKLLLSLFTVAFASAVSFAQLNGTYTVGGATPDYATLSAAVSALNANGVNGPVTFVIRDGSYSGTSWIGIINNVSGASTVNTITFRSQGGSKSSVTITETSSNNYIFRFNNAQHIIVRDMTFVKNSTSYGRVFDFGATTSSNISVTNCRLQGSASTSSSDAMALVYAYGHTGSNNSFTNCEFVNGGSFLYWRGSGTTVPSNDLTVANSTFTATSSGYYGIYTYYSSNFRFENNNVSRTGTGVYYALYTYYNNNNYNFNNNTFNCSSTSTMYFYQYYLNYINTNTSAVGNISGNLVNLTNTTGVTYAYTNYGYYTVKKNNVFNINSTTGGINCYGLYYHYNSLEHDNVYNMTASGSGYCNHYDLYYGFDSKSYNNVININTTSYAYLYTMMYGSGSEMYKNRYNVNITTSYVYPYIGYDCGGGTYRDNEVNLNVTTGTIYGVYSGYNVGQVYRNKFNFTATSGTIYGMYPNYMSSGSIFNNAVYIKSTGTVYNLYPYYCTGGTIANNTIHNEGTGTNSYLLYDYTTSNGGLAIKNNILSRKTASSNMVWAYGAAYSKSDYNLFYTPGNETYYSNTSPSTTVSTLDAWRAATGGRDRNSIFYQPAYVNASNGDLHINATSAAAWAVNGRAEQDTVIKTDLDSIVRPYLVVSGVPDIGAYEVVPTSVPPYATAMPANPVANSRQYFLFAQDTVATIDWGATVPASYDMRQYTGLKAAPIPAGVGQMYFYAAGTPSSYVHSYKPNVYYKDSWIGDIPGEAEAVIARSSNGGTWEGYNYSNAVTDITNNILSTAAILDSVGSYTGVQNGRIGIRCVENPVNIKISNVTAFAADVNWSPVFNPIGYQVVLKKTSEVPSVSEWNSASLPTTNSIALGGLEEDTKYYLFIRSICGLKDTSGYTRDSFTTLITCHAPTVQVTGVNDSRVVAFWNDIKTAVKYEYVLTNSPASPQFGTELFKTSMLNTILDDNKEYYVHVRAHCSTIYTESNWSSASFKTWKLGVSDISANGAGLSIYPNPVVNEATVVVAEVKGAAVIELMDIAGKVIKTQAVLASKTVVNLDGLPSGVYIVNYSDEINRYQLKFNKM